MQVEDLRRGGLHGCGSSVTTLERGWAVVCGSALHMHGSKLSRAWAAGGGAGGRAVMDVSCVMVSAYESTRPNVDAAPRCSTVSAAAANAASAPSVSRRTLSHLRPHPMLSRLRPNPFLATCATTPMLSHPRHNPILSRLRARAAARPHTAQMCPSFAGPRTGCSARHHAMSLS